MDRIDLRLFVTEHALLSEAEQTAVRVAGVVDGILDGVYATTGPAERGEAARAPMRWNLVDVGPFEKLQKVQPILQLVARECPQSKLCDADRLLVELLSKMRPATNLAFTDRAYCRDIILTANRLASVLTAWRLEMTAVIISGYHEPPEI
jgi:hypothetical protein